MFIFFFSLFLTKLAAFEQGLGQWAALMELAMWKELQGSLCDFSDWIPVQTNLIQQDEARLRVDREKNERDEMEGFFQRERKSVRPFQDWRGKEVPEASVTLSLHRIRGNSSKFLEFAWGRLDSRRLDSTICIANLY